MKQTKKMKGLLFGLHEPDLRSVLCAEVPGVYHCNISPKKGNSTNFDDMADIQYIFKHLGSSLSHHFDTVSRVHELTVLDGSSPFNQFMQVVSYRYTGKPVPAEYQAICIQSYTSLHDYEVQLTDTFFMAGVYTNPEPNKKVFVPFEIHVEDKHSPDRKMQKLDYQNPRHVAAAIRHLFLITDARRKSQNPLLPAFSEDESDLPSGVHLVPCEFPSSPFIPI